MRTNNISFQISIVLGWKSALSGAVSSETITPYHSCPYNQTSSFYIAPDNAPFQLKSTESFFSTKTYAGGTY